MPLHPTGPIGTAWPRTVELGGLLPPKNSQKLTCETEPHCAEWRPGEVTRNVLRLAGYLSVHPYVCLSVPPPIHPSVCLSVLGCRCLSVSIPVCVRVPACFYFTHTCGGVGYRKRRNPSWLCKDNSPRRGRSGNLLPRGSRRHSRALQCLLAEK